MLQVRRPLLHQLQLDLHMDDLTTPLQENKENRQSVTVQMKSIT